MNNDFIDYVYRVDNNCTVIVAKYNDKVYHRVVDGNIVNVIKNMEKRKYMDVKEIINTIEMSIRISYQKDTASPFIHDRSYKMGRA